MSNNAMKTTLIIIVIIVILGLGGLTYFFVSESNAVKNISDFAQCAQNGFPVQGNNPRQCTTPDGRTFTEVVDLHPVEPQPQPATTTTPTHPLVSVTSLKAGDTVRSPLTVTGQARGYWFFEASFPVELLDSTGKQIASGPAQAQGDWMTENFVPFSITLTFTNTQTQNGTLVLKKDNPSGLPEHEDELRIPVVIGAN